MAINIILSVFVSIKSSHSYFQKNNFNINKLKGLLPYLLEIFNPKKTYRKVKNNFQIIKKTINKLIED